MHRVSPSFADGAGVGRGRLRSPTHERLFWGVRGRSSPPQAASRTRATCTEPTSPPRRPGCAASTGCTQPRSRVSERAPWAGGGRRAEGEGRAEEGDPEALTPASPSPQGWATTVTAATRTGTRAGLGATSEATRAARRSGLARTSTAQVPRNGRGVAGRAPRSLRRRPQPRARHTCGRARGPARATPPRPLIGRGCLRAAELEAHWPPSCAE